MASVKVESKFSTENNALYNNLLGNGVKVGVLSSWYVDESINAHLFNYGGRGEMPEELGMPPNTSLLVINKTIYHIEYREKLVEVDNGYEIEFSICHFSVKGEEVLPRPDVYKILEQALFDYVQVLEKAYINAGHKFSIVLS